MCGEDTSRPEQVWCLECYPVLDATFLLLYSWGDLVLDNVLRSLAGDATVSDNISFIRESACDILILWCSDNRALWRNNITRYLMLSLISPQLICEYCKTTWRTFFTEFHRKYTKPFKTISKKLNHFLPKSLTECMSKCWGKKRNNDIWKAINTVKGWNTFRVFLNGEANMNYLCFWLKFHWYLKLHRQYS